MLVWLDLEDTIITTWDEGTLLHPTRIRSWLDERKDQIDQLNIWSFAIWNEKDKQDFVKSGMKTSLENALGWSINDFLSVEEMQAIILKTEQLFYESQMEFMQINGKHFSFMKYCLAEHPGRCCVLIDDAVPSLHIKDMKNGTDVHLINVGDL